MRKNKFLLPLIGAFLVSISGCDEKNVTLRVQCDHSYGYGYKIVDSQYHELICNKCGKVKQDSKETHDFDPLTNICKYCNYDKFSSDHNGACGIEHSWCVKKVIKEPTCTEPGQTERTCIYCGAREYPKPINPLGHDYVDDVDGYVPPTCIENGSKKQTCSRCGDKKDVVVAALGHDYSEWTTVEGKAPKCEEKGEEKHVCSRCNAKETREVDPIGHKFVVVGDDQPITEDFMRIYKCENGCGQVFLGFKATDVSEASKERLYFTEDSLNGEIGVSFWGRPIGNSLALDYDGVSVYQQNNECVYCSTETGDYFEYIFDLTAAQAAELSTCRCYCDARPAAFLSGDFWAYSANNTDWTPGYYIDGSDEHVQHNEDGSVMMVKDHARPVKDENGAEAEGAELATEVPMGARIEDYRYILYVNGQPQDFDPEISVPVQGSSTNMKRAEYVMPFTFHLHKGTNIIRLHMAGGYRSVFYAFYFRQYVAPTPIVVNESTLNVAEGKTAQITSDMTDLIFVSSDPNVASVDQTGLVTGVKAGTATITVSKEGNYKDAKVTVNVVEKEGTIALNLTDGVIAPEGGVNVYNSSSSGTWYNTFKKDATVTYTFQSTLAGEFDIKLGLRGSGIDIPTNIGIKVNGVDVTLAGTVDTSYSAVEYVVGKATLKVGENTLVITALQDSSLYLKTLKLIPTA